MSNDIFKMDVKINLYLKYSGFKSTVPLYLSQKGASHLKNTGEYNFFIFDTPNFNSKIYKTRYF